MLQNGQKILINSARTAKKFNNSVVYMLIT